MSMAMLVIVVVGTIGTVDMARFTMSRAMIVTMIAIGAMDVAWFVMGVMMMFVLAHGLSLPGVVGGVGTKVAAGGGVPAAAAGAAAAMV
ncbi:MAG: hypothetical protein ACRCZF_13195, partial [Gemmataceae bacterium]